MFYTACYSVPNAFNKFKYFGTTIFNLKLYISIPSNILFGRTRKVYLIFPYALYFDVFERQIIASFELHTATLNSENNMRKKESCGCKPSVAFNLLSTF